MTIRFSIWGEYGSMKTACLLTLGALLFGASCLGGPAKSVPPIVPIEGRQTNLAPVIGTLYLIAGSDLYTPADNPGPASTELSIAWQIANEFVFRTALQAKYSLPAGSSRLLKNGDALVSFMPKQPGKELTVLVHWKKRTAEIPKP